MLQTTKRLAAQNQYKNRPLAFTGRGLKALQRGFTLVEIALVLLISGLALGAGVSILRVKLAQAKIDVTKARAEAIRVALTNYVAQNYRLPCPADPLITKGLTNYNVASPAVIGACTSGTPLFLNIGTAPSTVSRGTVPCATLGIAEDACTDGYGNRFTYFVDNRAVILTMTTVSGMQGSMTVHKITPPAAATPSVGAAPTGNQINACSSIANDNSCNLAAVAMVISHGANKGGAFPPGIATPYAITGTPPPISDYEKVNTDNNIQFIQNDYIEEGTYSFDDLVVSLVPRDVIASLSQVGAIKQTSALTTERFEAIKFAIITQSFAPPIGTGITPNRKMTLSEESGVTAPYVFPSALILDFTGCILVPTDTKVLPLTTPPASQTNVPALAGLANDLWGTPIRYKRTVTVEFGTDDSCVTPFVLISYGPDKQTGGVFANDDIVFPVTKADIAITLGKLGLTW